MKKVIFGLLICLSLSLAACSKGGSNIDYKALSQKAENNPTALTQQDYSDMIEFLDYAVDSKDKFKDDDEDVLNITLALTGALFAGEGIDNGYTPLDASNKEKFEKLQSKIQKL